MAFQARQHQGVNLTINYSFAVTMFGEIIIASTAKGVCHLFFIDDRNQALADLAARFPKAQYKQTTDSYQQKALSIFLQDWKQLSTIKLHLKSTEFQLKVWQALLTIPSGQLLTYSDIAKKIDQPKAARSVGTAIASNPIAFLIPCHRVIQANGNFGDYMWGKTRKSAIIGWEASQLSQ